MAERSGSQVLYSRVANLLGICTKRTSTEVEGGKSATGLAVDGSFVAGWESGVFGEGRMGLGHGIYYFI